MAVEGPHLPQGQALATIPEGLRLGRLTAKQLGHLRVSTLLIAAPDLTLLQGALAAIRRQDELQYQKRLTYHREMPREDPDPPVLSYRVEAYTLPVSWRPW